MIEKTQGQVKYGAIISYVLIIGNALYGLVVTPYVLDVLGASSYGVYKTIGSFSNALIILDLGIGGTIMRYVAKYRATARDEKIGPFISMMICEAGILLFAVAIIEFLLFFQLDSIYSASFSTSELLLAKKLYIILSANVLLIIVENFLTGIITGSNNFIFGNGTKLLKLIIRIILIFFLLPLCSTPIVLVTINLFLSAMNIVVQLIYIGGNYKIKLNFDIKVWEKGIFRESFLYTILTFLAVLAAQVNGNLDNVIIGAFCGPEKVAVYSFALIIFGMFEQLSTSVSNVVLPTVTTIVVQSDWRSKTQAYVVKIGRIQFMLLGAAVVGFAVLGKQFLFLWLGNGYEDVYGLVLILMIPSLFELCVNVCLAVLRAQNRLGFRTTILTISTVLNLIVSVVGISYIGYYAAALGTAVSFAVGSLIIMNIYYCKTLGFNMLAVYRGIFKRIWVCQILAGGTILVSSRLFSGSWIAFIINVFVFMIVYAGTLLLFGLTSNEKMEIKKSLIKRG